MAAISDPLDAPAALMACFWMDDTLPTALSSFAVALSRTASFSLRMLRSSSDRRASMTASTDRAPSPLSRESMPTLTRYRNVSESDESPLCACISAHRECIPSGIVIVNLTVILSCPQWVPYLIARVSHCVHIRTQSLSSPHLTWGYSDACTSARSRCTSARNIAFC